MSVYLYNLGFNPGDQYGQAGAFDPYVNTQAGLNQSSAWLKYNGSGTPSGVTDNLVPLASLTATDWNFMQTNMSPMTLNPGDYVIWRVFPSAANPPSCNVRVTGVIGRGTDSPAPAGTQSQAPFMMGASQNQPRPVIDCDNTSGANWPAATGNDGAWTYCVGMIHVIGDFTLNLGASVYVNSGPQAGNTFLFGQDPQLHVVTAMMAKPAA